MVHVKGLDIVVEVPGSNPEHFFPTFPCNFLNFLVTALLQSRSCLFHVFDICSLYPFILLNHKRSVL